MGLDLGVLKSLTCSLDRFLHSSTHSSCTSSTHTNTQTALKGEIYANMIHITLPETNIAPENGWLEDDP